MKKGIVTVLFLILFIMIEEIAFSYFAFNEVQNIIYILLFSIPIGLVLSLLTGFLSSKVNAGIAYILVFLISFIFGAQLVYYKIYQSIISIFSMTNGGGQILQFVDMIGKTILENWIGIAVLFLPFILMIVLHATQCIDFKKTSYKVKFIKLLCVIFFQFIPMLMLLFSPKNSIYGEYNLYYKVHTPTLTAQKFGILTEMRIDLQRLIFGFEEQNVQITPPTIERPTEETKEEELKYNQIEIDFNTLIENEANTTVKQIHRYMQMQNPTQQNEYTGMFEGKNLIVFVAEGFSSFAIREDVTPNLYKLYQEGFQFENFYTPIFPVSTADGEYVTDTSLIPKEGVWSMARIANNDMPYSYANVFKKLGYSTNAYHNHTSTYYDRDKYIKGMGYDSYLAKGTGLEKRMDCTKWPNSDDEMIRVTTDDYMNNDKFLAYYMTVSGHLNYTTNGNYIANKNWSEVKDLPYSHNARAYLATQIELDRAIGRLIEDLKAKGKLKDTVIMISSDHYPYGLTLEQINELSNYERDNTFEKYHMPFLVWNSEMKETIKVEKLGSSLDILPTMLNLFGVKYDSRLLIGKDILSTEDSLIIFSDRSFITDKGRYNAITKKFTPVEGAEIPEGYVEDINAIIYQKYQMSKLILETNYYEKVITKNKP